MAPTARSGTVNKARPAGGQSKILLALREGAQYYVI